MKKKILPILVTIIFLTIGITPVYAFDQYESMKVGETKTFYFPSEVTSRASSMYAYNCTSDHINNVEVVSYTNTSVTVKALSYTQYTVNIRFDYWWYENGYGRTDTHMVHIDLYESGGGGGGNTDGNENPGDYYWDKGCWGTINIFEGESKTLYCQYDTPNPDKVKSIVWSHYGSVGYEITSQSSYSCTIMGSFGASNQKLWCLMKYGNTSYKAYYLVNVVKNTQETLTLMANPNGGTVNTGTTVTLSSSVSGSDIYYTLDGSKPTTNSLKYKSSGIPINESCTLKAFARKSGYNDSPVMTWVFTAVKSGNCGNNVTYAFADDTGILTIAGSGPMKDYDTYSSLPWYKYKNKIKKVVIESGVTSIGKIAFDECTNLESVSIGKDVTKIGSSAFSDCIRLSSIDIPDNVTFIDEWAFYKCSALKYITIGKGITSISPYAFYQCNNVKKLTLDCKEIGYSWFSSSNNIEEIVIGNNVKSLGGTESHDGVFERFANLSKVTIGKNLENIGTRTFRNCSSLISLNIPNSVRMIGMQAFENCTNLTSVELPNSITGIERGVFWNCSKLTSVTIPSSVTSIGMEAFEGCTGLTSISIPQSVTSIGMEAFDGCTGLTSISIPHGVTSIGMWAFRKCTGLKEVWSYIIEPFNISSSFDDNTDAITLYVPAGTKEKYKNASGWNKFKNIVEMAENSINNIMVNDIDSNRIYSISGQKLKTPKMGINIINGKKYVKK